MTRGSRSVRTRALLSRPSRLLRRLRTGAFQVFIPDDQDPEGCLYGRIPASAEMDQTFIDTWDEQAFTVRGLSLPTFVQ